jgi:hypothetical protein
MGNSIFGSTIHSAPDIWQLTGKQDGIRIPSHPSVKFLHPEPHGVTRKSPLSGWIGSYRLKILHATGIFIDLATQNGMEAGDSAWITP